MKGKRRLLWFLFPTYLSITLGALAAAGLLAVYNLHAHYLRLTAEELTARARMIEEQVGTALAAGNIAALDAMCKRLGARVDTRITVVLSSGTVVADAEESAANMGSHADRPEVQAALSGQIGEAIRYSRTLQKDMLYIALPLWRDGVVEACLRLALPLTRVEGSLRRFRWHLLAGGALVALAAAAVSLAVSRRIARPIVQTRTAAEQFAQGRLDVRLPTSPAAELAALAEAMNRMARQLAERIDTIVTQRNELEAVLTSMHEGVLAVDGEEHLFSVNPAAAGMLARSAQSLRGRSIQEATRSSALQQMVRQVLTSGEPAQGDIVLYQGGERVIQVHVTALRGAQDARGGALVVMSEVTHLRRLESMRRDFAANVSHEIKTPLTAIKGFVETLRHGGVDDPNEAKRFLGIIERHVDRLASIIEDLLKLSRLEQEHERDGLPLAMANLQQMLQEAIQICQPKAHAKAIDIRCECPAGLMARMDAALLEQAVVNLLDNAITYSGDGSCIDVRVATTPGEIRIAVHDRGPGIAREHLDRLFERFYRVDKARSRNLGGTGLGLAIVKHIVQAHGGRVAVESAVGRGSTFTLHLPQAGAAPALPVGGTS
jgi:two-component system phosphate regulon sensor histidine kinase PhoR